MKTSTLDIREQKKLQEQNAHRRGSKEMIEGYAALKVYSDYVDLPPNEVSKAIKNHKAKLKICPDCLKWLTGGAAEKSSPRDEYNVLQEFEQGEYKCKSCAGD